jgi:predicted ATPase/class 3 adenylate cyclase
MPHRRGDGKSARVGGALVHDVHSRSCDSWRAGVLFDATPIREAPLPTIEEWLASVGMSEYTQAFLHHGIDLSSLPHLTDRDLQDIGVLLGHRRKILAAITELADAHPALSAGSRAEQPTQAYAERRLLTVMLCDLAGSTALSERFDPEDLRGIIDSYYRCCTELIQSNGGFVAQYVGDGVLAYFGYPRAHEHDAERAVRAGLALAAAVPRLTTDAGFPLQVRIGIATGQVVVGDLAVGETPNLAARLQTLAEPGTVVIASTTHSLAGGLFEYRDLGAVALKGFAEHVRAWQVLGPSGVESRFEALRANTTPLIDRGEEIDLLLRRWEQARRGEGSIVLMSGEPGIGKSRIAQTILERLSTEPHTRLRYFCSPHHRDSALYPSITQLTRAADLRRDDTDAQRLAKLEAVLSLAGDDLRETVPLLADLLSVPTGNRYPRLALTPEKRKEKTLEALVAQVEGLAARQPVMVVGEDAHWADPTSLELLDLMVERTPSLPVLLIITFRPEFLPPWAGRSHVTLLTLNRLPRRLSTDMIMQVAGGKVLPQEITNEITERSDGVPLFIEEMTKAVVESGIPDASGSRAAAAGQKPVAVPTSLQASLLARLDRLGQARDVAQIASAVGRRFSYELINAVAGVAPEELNRALAQLERAELVFRHGIPPDAEYTFKHALVQDAAYGTLLRQRRQQLHARIAATLEEKLPHIVAAQPALLARHCAEGGLAEKAVLYWLKAGQQALARSAMTEAVAQLRKGLDVLAGLPDSPWRRRQEFHLQIALRPALAATKGYSSREVGEAIERARTLAEETEQSEQLAPLLLGQWAFYTAQSQHKRALHLAEQSERTAGTHNDARTQMLARSAIGLTRCYLGEFTAARTLLEACQDLGVAPHRAVNAGHTIDPFVGNLAYLALDLAYLGYVDQARLRVDEALSEARRLQQPHLLAFVLVFAAWIDALLGAPELEAHAQELLAVANEGGLSYFLGPAMKYRGWSLTVLGQMEEGLSLLTQGLTVMRTTATIPGTPNALIMLAETYGTLGRLAEGLECLTEAAQIIEATDERIDESDLHRVRGVLLKASGDLSGAERNYHRAIEIARRQSAKLAELRAALGLAQLWRLQNKGAAGTDLVAPIVGWFTEGSGTPVIAEAKALLSRGGDRNDRDRRRVP